MQQTNMSRIINLKVRVNKNLINRQGNNKTTRQILVVNSYDIVT